MFHFKKFTCSLLAALAIGSTVLSIPAGTSQMLFNAVNAVAANKEPDYHFLNNYSDHYVTTKTMNVRYGPGTKYSIVNGNSKINAGMMIDTTGAELWVNPKNPSNIWVRNFKYYGVDFYPKTCRFWMCISNSSIKKPNYTIENETTHKISVYAKPDLNSSKSTVNIEPYNKYTSVNLDFNYLPIYINVQRINNNNWGKVSLYDHDTLNVISGYIFMCDYENKIIYDIRTMSK
jgi:hypothetical protein